MKPGGMSGLYFFAGGGVVGGGGCGVVGCSARHGACRSEVQADSASATNAKATEILLQRCTEGPGGNEYEICSSRGFPALAPKRKLDLRMQSPLPVDYDVR
jgi:hypothetical protein